MDDIAVSIFEKFLLPFIYLIANYYILRQLNHSESAENAGKVAISFIILYYALSLFNHTIHALVVLYMESKGEPPHRIKQVAGILFVVKVISWSMGIIMLADNFGYNVTTVIAGLGVGGIAIALAAQSILGDLFSYIVIFFDKPFETGDFIVMGEHSGTVEMIGIKTTHVRSLDGQQLILPNAEMAKSVIQNYKRLERRRIVFNIGVEYSTSSLQLNMIPKIVQQNIEHKNNVEFARVHLTGFGDFSINFEIVYFILSADYVIFRDVHQEICLSIFSSFEEQKIAFAYPTQKIIF